MVYSSKNEQRKLEWVLMMTKEEKKEVKKKKLMAEKEKIYREFFHDSTDVELLYRFMKKYSMNEAVALKILKDLKIPIYIEQITFAREKRKAMKKHNKEKRNRKKEVKEQNALLEYKESIILNFMETAEIDTVEEYLIIKGELF